MRADCRQREDRALRWRRICFVTKSQSSVDRLAVMARTPQFELFEASSPTISEPSHPVPVRSRFRKINHDPHERVAVEDTSLTPMTFNPLGLVTNRAEVIRYLQDCLGEPFTGD